MLGALHLPEVTTVEDDGVNASFVLEPLYRGFGVTLGNAMRRVLMSSLEGAAITAFKVEGASHEFSSLAGVTEDIVEITLNLKRLRFRVFSDEPQVLELTKKGKGVVKAGDIKTNASVEVVNPDAPIARIDNDKATLKMQLRIEKGRGYHPVEDRHGEELEVGMIAIDALFSPVQRVRYNVTPTRVGQVTGLDKLTLEVTTDVAITPTEALQQAAAILVEQLSVIAGDARTSSNAPSASVTAADEEPDELNFSVEDLNLSPRTTNALINNSIMTVRELIQLSDSELKRLKGFGAKAYQEVADKLKELELR